MDWGNRCYRTLARFHDSPDAPAFGILWYFTDLPFQDHPSSINSLVWDEYPYRDKVLGEVFGAPRTFIKNFTIPGLNGEHECGTPAEFLDGAPWPYTGPDIAYDKDNIPLCCNRDQLSTLKIGIRPNATVSRTQTYQTRAKVGLRLFALVMAGPNDATRGGVAMQFQIGEVFSPADPTAGGVAMQFQVGNNLVYTDATAGAVAMQFQVGDTATYTDATAGAVAMQFQVGDTATYTDPTAGGLALGGACGDVFSPNDPTAGGLALGGACGDVFRVSDATAGGLALGGATGDVMHYTDATAGGLALGGSCGDTFTPGGPASTTGTTSTVTLPTNASGGVLVIFCKIHGSAPTVTGWTREVHRFDNDANEIAVYTHASGISGTVTINLCTAWRCYYVAGKPTTDGVASLDDGGLGSVTVTWAGVTTTGSADMLFIALENDGNRNMNFPAGFTVDAVVGSKLQTAYKTLSSSGATGNFTGSLSASYFWASATIAFK